MPLHGGLAVITGASRGIGAETAMALARAGLRVVLVARDGERLDELAARITAAGGTAVAMPADVGVEDERERLLKEVERRCGAVDVLVNNAGFGVYADVAETSWETARALLAVNVAGAVHLTRLVLPGMLERERGHVVNIGSLAGYVAAPPLTLYATTKFALVGFTEGLARELRRRPGVHATVVSPAPVRTDFGRVASGRAVDPRRVPGGVRPRAVARAVVRALRRPRRRIVVPRRYAAAVPLSRLAPGLVGLGAASQSRRWRRGIERAAERAAGVDEPADRSPPASDTG